MKKKIYIAGKISGEAIHKVSMKFGQAQMQLEAKGYLVINPLTIVGDWHCSWQQAMKICIPALVECDGIHLLADFRESKGAKMEYDIAIALGLELIE